MPVPVALATLAATGSIVTSIKSGWELRRMIKRKTEEKEAEEEAPYVFRKLVRAYQAGLLSDAEYDIWYEKFLVAKVERDLSGLHRIRAHLRILYQGAPGGDRRPSTRHGSGSSSSRHGSSSSSSSSARSSGHGSGSSSSSRHDDEKRGHWDAEKTKTKTTYVSPPKKQDDLEWPKSAGSIEYFPLRKQSTTSYARGGSSKGSASDVSPKSPSAQRSKSVRYDDERSSRSRSRRHRRSDGDDDTDDAYRHRGRSRKR